MRSGLRCSHLLESRYIRLIRVGVQSLGTWIDSVICLTPILGQSRALGWVRNCRFNELSDGQVLRLVIVSEYCSYIFVAVSYQVMMRILIHWVLIHSFIQEKYAVMFFFVPLQSIAWYEHFLLSSSSGLFLFHDPIKSWDFFWRII